MLTGPALTAAIAHAPTRPLRGTYFRATSTAHVTDPLARHRPLPLARNRYNVRGGARVLYIAEDMFTAIHELQAFAWPPKAISLVPVRFELNSVLDLTDGKVHQLLQTTQTELDLNFRSVPVGGPPTATQELAEACAASGRIDALLFFSCALPPGATPKVNLALLEYLVARENQSVGRRQPWWYFEEVPRNKRARSSAIRSHLIPNAPDQGIWDRSIKRGFKCLLEERRRLVIREFERVAGMRLFERE